MPEVSAIASWMDNLKLPIREIENTYTLSELVMMSWHSRLQNYNMSKRFAHNKATPKLGDGKTVTIDSNRKYNPNGVRETEDSYILPEGINQGVPIPKKFFDEEGNFDLRRASGMEAVTYLRRLGINLVVPMMMS
jgi:hypothetical protein